MRECYDLVAAINEQYEDRYPHYHLPKYLPRKKIPAITTEAAMAIPPAKLIASIRSCLSFSSCLCLALRIFSCFSLEILPPLPSSTRRIQATPAFKFLPLLFDFF